MMERYFSNPELKKSSVILFSITALFMLLAVFAFNLYSSSLKEDYIKTFGAITSIVLEKDPALEQDIVPLITKGVSDEEAIKGEAVLSRYGLTGNLANTLFPYINKTILKNEYMFFLIFILMAAALFSFNYFQHRFFYKRIRRLTIGAKKVVEGEYDITIDENGEGDFSRLSVAFNSMREIIRNKINELKEEKQFLVDLLSDISHQIKTPLSSMIVYNDILLNKELSREQSMTFLIKSQNQLNRMNWLIQSMLKLAKLDAKAIELDKEKQSLNETIQESIDTLERKAAEGDIRVVFEECGEVSSEHDRLWLEEAFINIIKNSIEHTPPGGEIKISLTENPVYTKVIVEDNGEGIKEEDLPNIFRRFYKARSLKKTDSVGIGLALAKSIVESHNGIIEAKSRPGAGTVFTVTFLKY